MHGDSPGKLRHTLPLYLACYALWLALTVLGGWLLFETREAVFDLTLWLRLNPWQVRAVDQFYFVIAGLVWLIGMLLLEHYLRQGVAKNRLWGRAARVFVFEAVALGIAYGVQLLLA